MEDLLSERDDLKKRVVIDSVLASDPEYPYTQRTITIEGLEREEDKVDNRIINMELRRVRRLQDTNDLALSEIRQAVDDIDDEYVRAIITYRFIRGMSWKQVAFRMGGGVTESAVRMAYNRFIEKD